MAPMFQIGYKACSAGNKEQEANNFLEKKIKANPDMNLDQTIEVCFSSTRVERSWICFVIVFLISARLFDDTLVRLQLLLCKRLWVLI